LSRYPKADEPISVTLLICGYEKGEPLACVGDDYVIGSEPPIEFTKHILRVSSVSESHEAKLIFESQKGFCGDGEYKIWINKVDDEACRTEITYELGVKKDTLPIEPIKISTSTDNTPSPQANTSESAPPPKAKSLAHPLYPRTAEKPPQSPAPAENTKRKSRFGLVVAIGTIGALLIIAALIFFNKKEEPPVQAKTTTTHVIKQDATNEAPALSPTDPKSIEKDDLVKTEEEAQKEEALPVPESAKPEPPKALAPIPPVAKPQSMATPENSAPPKPVMRSIKIEY
jgi:hypothetical protein